MADQSEDLKSSLLAALRKGLEDEDPGVVAKFAGHALAYLRAYPPEDETGEILFKGPTKGALASYTGAGSA